MLFFCDAYRNLKESSNLVLVFFFNFILRSQFSCDPDLLLSLYSGVTSCRTWEPYIVLGINSCSTLANKTLYPQTCFVSALMVWQYTKKHTHRCMHTHRNYHSGCQIWVVPIHWNLLQIAHNMMSKTKWNWMVLGQEDSTAIRVQSLKPYGSPTLRHLHNVTLVTH